MKPVSKTISMVPTLCIIVSNRCRRFDETSKGGGTPNLATWMDVVWRKPKEKWVWDWGNGGHRGRMVRAAVTMVALMHDAMVELNVVVVAMIVA